MPLWPLTASAVPRPAPLSRGGRRQGSLLLHRILSQGSLLLLHRIASARLSLYQVNHTLYAVGSPFYFVKICGGRLPTHLQIQPSWLDLYLRVSEAVTQALSQRWNGLERRTKRLNLEI